MRAATRIALLAFAAAVLASGCRRDDEAARTEAALPPDATRADSLAAGEAIHAPPPLDPHATPRPAGAGATGVAGEDQNAQGRPGTQDVQPGPEGGWAEPENTGTTPP
jgi:hypothetical protein